MLCADHQAITAYIVQPICIELTRYNCRINRTTTTSAYNVGDVVSKARTQLFKFLRNLSIAYQAFADEFMIGQLEAESPSNILEGVTKRAMAHVVNQGCSQRLVSPSLFKWVRILANDIH